MRIPSTRSCLSLKRRCWWTSGRLGVVPAKWWPRWWRKELAEEYGDRLSFAKVNVDDNGKVATRYGIQSIPTLLLFSKGKPVHQVVGFKPKGELKRILDAAVA
jgi:hypothetical protein